MALGLNGEKTIADINKGGNAGTARFYHCDIALLKEVEQLAKSLKSEFPKIHVLINNAGIIVEKRQETPEGFERTFA